MKNQDPEAMNRFLKMREDWRETTEEGAEYQLEAETQRRDKAANLVLDYLDSLETFRDYRTRQTAQPDALFAEHLASELAAMPHQARERFMSLYVDWKVSGTRADQIDFALEFNANNEFERSIFAPPKPPTAPRRRAFD